MLIALSLLISAFAAAGNSADPAAAVPWGGECGYIRLDKPGPWGRPDRREHDRNKWEGSMQNVPFTDQGHTGFCYAHAATQMIDAYRFSHGDPMRDFHTAPFEAAVECRNGRNAFMRLFSRVMTFGRSPFDNGSACDVASCLVETGSCNYVDLMGMNPRDARQTIEHDGLVANGYDRSYIDQIGDLYDRYHALMELQAGQTLNGHTRSEGLSELCTVLQPLTSTNPSLPLLEHLLEGDRINFIHGVTAAGCHTRLMPPKLACQSHPLMSPAYYEAVLNQRLNRFAPVQPVEIDYCARVLETGPGTNGVLTPGGCDPHSSLVIGRRRDPHSGHCQFLIRNSWGHCAHSGNYDGRGVSEGGYHKQWTCGQDDEALTDEDRRVSHALDGSIWVDADDLTHNMFGVSYLGAQN